MTLLPFFSFLFQTVQTGEVGQTDKLTNGRTDGQTDGRYQVHYFPRFAVDKNPRCSLNEQHQSLLTHRIRNSQYFFPSKSFTLAPQDPQMGLVQNNYS